MSITELAPAKLNLTLDVGARRPDGYHEITSVMQSAALYDVVTLETVETDDIVVECPGTDLPTGPDNLAWKAHIRGASGPVPDGADRVRLVDG